MTESNYDKFPFIPVPNGDGKCVEGWKSIVDRLRACKSVLTVECYPGVDVPQVKAALSEGLRPTLLIETGDLMWSPKEIDRMVKPFLSDIDTWLGFLCPLEMPAFFDLEKVKCARKQVEEAKGLVLIVGPGATLVDSGEMLVYADLARWEGQLRFRRDEADNLGAKNCTEDVWEQYRRSYFVDWRVADRWKKDLIARWDFVLDTCDANSPKLAEGEAVRDALEACTTHPFRVVPMFDPAPWGGQWMRQVCGLNEEAPNFGWCFDCVPEENSLLLDFGNLKLEIPSIDLIFYKPLELLGEEIYRRFGDEFPIRFNFLDTMGGGNLSLQVHPTVAYIRETFGMSYTQDESYYIIDSTPASTVYLGFKEGVSSTDMMSALHESFRSESEFNAEDFVNRWPAKKHDHFLIPAGTIHCSGNNTMVLEISATPFIFTFKLWDWNRLGLDGKPRAISIGHGSKVLDWSRTREWTQQNLVNRVEVIEQKPGYTEERTGLHESEFIETRRHWFTEAVEHHTNGTLNVLNLVEGDAVLVKSPTNAFEPMVIHYAETFIVPATVGRYTIEPLEGGLDRPYATIKAYVRPEKDA